MSEAIYTVCARGRGDARVVDYSNFRMDADNYSDYGFVTPDYSNYGKVT